MSKKSDSIHDRNWRRIYITTHVNAEFGDSVQVLINRKENKKRKLTAKKHTVNVLVKHSDKLFEEVLEMWMDNNRLRLKGGTISKYRNLIDTHIAPGLGKIRMTELNTMQINNFLEEKLRNGRINGQGGLSPSYVRSMTLVINAAMKYAAEENFCTPLRTAIYKPGYLKRDLPVLSRDEQRWLECNLLQDSRSLSVGILLALHTGMRLGEICGLSWLDVNLENKIIRVRHTVTRVNNETQTGSKTILYLDTPKTQASIREIPISETLASVLNRFHEKTMTGFVLSGTEAFTQPRTLEYHFHKVLRECGIPIYNFHALRHTFATRCVEVGVDVKSLSEILGHANVGITLNTYVHSSLEMKRSQLEKLVVLSG